MSVLANYSELNGRLVSDKRCCQSGTSLLSASLNISFGRIKQSFVLTDAHLPDMPIVYASDAFLKLTGFLRHEVLGRNCRFLSGEDTDRGTQFQVAYFVGIQIEDTSEAREKQGLNPEMSQHSVVAAVKVAVRGWSMVASTS